MISGSIVALLTPMHQGTLEVDWGALKKLVDWHIEQGTNSIVAVGTTGESATLSVAEHAEVIRVVVEQAAGRIPVIAGTGANSTSEAIELTQAAAEAGADACLLVTPYYNKPTQEGLYLHYKAIADAVDIETATQTRRGAIVAGSRILGEIGVDKPKRGQTAGVDTATSPCRTIRQQL